MVKIPEEKLITAANEAWKIITNKEIYTKLVEENYGLGKANFSYENTLVVLAKLLT